MNKKFKECLLEVYHSEQVGEMIFEGSQAVSGSRAERAKTARKKKAAGRKGKTVVANTQKAKVRNMNNGGAVSTTKPKRKFNGKNMPGTAVARGCGAIMANKRKRTKGAVTQS